MTECNEIQTCAFIKTYESQAPGTIQSIIEMYCRGENTSECVRLEYISKTGGNPEATMMPTGRDVESGQIVRF